MGWRASHRRWRRQAGFSLLELLFVFVISITALLLASELLVEAQVRMAHAAREALDPVGELAAEQLRADLRAAAGVRVPLTSGWSRDPLVLLDHPAGPVRYVETGSRLVRELDRGGGDVARRTVLHAVTTFRWRLGQTRFGGRTVIVDLRHRETPRLGLLAAGGTREAPIPEEHRLLFRVRPRGGGGRSW